MGLNVSVTSFSILWLTAPPPPPPPSPLNQKQSFLQLLKFSQNFFYSTVFLFFPKEIVYLMTPKEFIFSSQCSLWPEIKPQICLITIGKAIWNLESTFPSDCLYRVRFRAFVSGNQCNAPSPLSPPPSPPTPDQLSFGRSDGFGAVFSWKNTTGRNMELL